MANLWMQLGQPARALQALKTVDPAVVAQRPGSELRRHTILGRIDRALGRASLPRLRQALTLPAAERDSTQRMLAELDVARELTAEEAVEACLRVQREADAGGRGAIAMRARVLGIEAQCRAGATAAAASQTREAATVWQDRRPADLYWPEVLWIGQSALLAAGDVSAAQALHDQAVRWVVDAALTHVPEVFRDSFIHRNPVNRAVLAGRGRRALR